MLYVIKAHKKFDWGIRVLVFPAKESGEAEWTTLADMKDTKIKDEKHVPAAGSIVEGAITTIRGEKDDGQAFVAKHFRLIS